MKYLAIAVFGLAGFVLVDPAWADDLTGVDRFICSAGSVSACCDDGQCASGTAAELGVPQFMEIDLAQKQINSTKASRLNRTTTLEYVKRANGTIMLQGVDIDRAYSFVINEKSGEISATVAIEDAGCNVVAFGWCTPLPAGK
jgi:hypothetical protein